MSLWWVVDVNKPFQKMYLSGITFCAFLKLPPVSASDEEETTFLRVFYSVKIGQFGVVLPLE